MELNPQKKLAGILAPVFALKGTLDLGVGDTAALEELLTWAKANKVGAIQVLPVNEPGGDHSPYNLLSAMALDPLTAATVPGRLPGLSEDDFREICKRHGHTPSDRVDYPAVSALKRGLFEAAFAGLGSRMPAGFRRFLREQADWIHDYATHRALVDLHGSEVSSDWPEDHRSPEAARAWLESRPAAERRAFRKREKFFCFVQWVTLTQWLGVRKLAEAAGVALIGDLPVGVSLYSADTWARPGIFDLTRSSGAPPEKVFKSDPFTEQWGQNWGFPLYDWRAMAADNFAWWRMRLRHLLKVFHLVRADHALGFFRIYSFPWRPEENHRFVGLTPEQAAEITGGPLPGFIDFPDDTDEHREHNRRKGEMTLRMFLEECGAHRLVAEDLGEVAPYVRPVLAELEIPGFKIPQWEKTWDRLTPGRDYPRISLATFATHDHPPLRAAWEELTAISTDQSATPAQRDGAIHQLWEFAEFCGRPDLPLPRPFDDEVHLLMLKGLLLSNSWLAVHMVTDLFGLADRFNIPGSPEGNWTYRIPWPVREWNARHQSLLAHFREAIAESGRA